MKEIPLTLGLSAIVDNEDYEALAPYRWHAVKIGNTFYATRAENKRTIYMHRAVLSAPAGTLVDHVSMDGLDNRRENLRLATRAQNAQNQKKHADNTSGYKGVSWHKQTASWMAKIHANGRQVYLGLFPSPDSAYAAYCSAAEKYYGEFARTQIQCP